MRVGKNRLRANHNMFPVDPALTRVTGVLGQLLARTVRRRARQGVRSRRCTSSSISLSEIVSGGATRNASSVPSPAG